MTQYLGTHAAITWVPSTADGDTSAQRVHLLARPLQNARPGFSQAVFTNHSLDRSTIDTIAIGTGAHELVGSAQMDDNPQSLLDVITAGAQGQTLFYIPDLRDPDQSYACRLVAPLDVNAAQVEADQQRAQFGDASVTLRLRQTDETRFDAIYQGTPVLFHYRAGGSLADATFTRADTAHYTSANGTLAIAQSGKTRISWHDVDGDGFTETPVLLLEDTRTNLVTESEDFSTWTDISGTPTQAASQADPKGGTAAVLLTDNDGASAEAIGITTAFTGDAVKGQSLFVRQGSATTSQLIMWDVTAAAARLSMDLTWASDGTPSLAETTGTFLQYIPYRGGWYRLLFQTASVTAANTNSFRIVPAFPAASTGDLYIFGAQAEDAEEPSSYNPTSGGTDTRAGDVLQFPFLARPQAMSIYHRHIALGYYSPTGNRRAWQIATSANNRLLLVLGASETWVATYTVGGSGNTTGAPAGTVAYGDTVELLVTLATTGIVNITQSINGGTPTAGAATSAAAMAPAWDEQVFYVGGLTVTSGACLGHRDVLTVRGVQSLTTMRRMAGV